MGAQEIVVGLIVAGAVVWLVRVLIRRARGGGCECTSASTCPYAGGPECGLRTRPTNSESMGKADAGTDE